MLERKLTRVENGVLMRIKHHLLRDIITLEHLLPFTQVQESVVEGNPRRNPIPLHQFRNLCRPLEDISYRKREHQRLIDKSIDRDHILVARLREELGDPVVEFKGTLPVQCAVVATNPVDIPLAAAVVPPVLAAN